MKTLRMASVTCGCIFFTSPLALAVEGGGYIVRFRTRAASPGLATRDLHGIARRQSPLTDQCLH
jgi:hypothetical protein